MKFQYKRMPLNSVKDYDRVDRLLAQGWKAIQSGLFSVLLEKKVTK